METTDCKANDRGVLLVLFGPPGSGKGTQAELLSSRLGFVHYSTGEVFRDHIKRKSPLGLKVESYVAAGGLVPDEIVLEVVDDFVRKNLAQPIVFDGFPRTVPQAEGLDRLLRGLGRELTFAVLIDLDDDEVVRRLSSRRQCANCGKIYNLTFSPPKRDGVCDDCGGELYQRADDREETIRARLAVYKKETKPLVDYYQQRGKMVCLNGGLGRDRVFEELVGLIGRK
ncbi:MAG: adenylate kinase [candidate division WOR-3 bacterium]